MIIFGVSDSPIDHQWSTVRMLTLDVFHQFSFPFALLCTETCLFKAGSPANYRLSGNIVKGHFRKRIPLRCNKLSVSVY